MDNVHDMIDFISQKKAVLFDMDGVLVDTSMIHDHAFKSALNSLGSEFDYSKYSGMNTYDALRDFLTREEIIDKLTATKRKIAFDSIKNAPLYPYSREILTLLKKKGFKLALATSAQKARAMEILSNHGISGLFDIIITADDIHMSKPYPDIYLKCLEKLKMPAKDAIVIEDSQNGINAAKSAGMDVIALSGKVNLSDYTFSIRDIYSLYSIFSYYFSLPKDKKDDKIIEKKVMTIIPAAGRGTRLGFSKPKILFPIVGRPALLHLYDKVAEFSDRIILVINKESEKEVRNVLVKEGIDIDIVIDPDPHGTGGSVLEAARKIGGRKDVLIIWGDQIGLNKESLSSLISYHQKENSDLSLPTLIKKDPYIHIKRGVNGDIEKVLKKRMNDHMPEYGESDSGIFITKSDILLEMLSKMNSGIKVSEYNPEGFDFLPYISLLSANGYKVNTIDCVTLPETIGMNTPEEAQFHEDIFRKQNNTKMLK